MKTLKTIFVVVFITSIVSNASARDDIGSYSVNEALSTEQAKAKLGNNIKFYFGDTSHGTVSKKFGVYGTNKKTNAFNKSDREACEWAFLSAMISLRNRAMQLGGNAVINIKSNYRNNLTTSNDTFQCGAGAFVAGVALQGEVVKIGK